MVEGEVENRVGFEMVGDETRVGFGHVIAIVPNQNPIKSRLVWISVRQLILKRVGCHIVLMIWTQLRQMTRELSTGKA
jgi:hypothetical protein